MVLRVFFNMPHAVQNASCQVTSNDDLRRGLCSGKRLPRGLAHTPNRNKRLCLSVIYVRAE